MSGPFSQTIVTAEDRFMWNLMITELPRYMVHFSHK